MGGKYDDFDWEELPDDVKNAATVLGYNEKKWDNDEKVEVDKYDWNELTAEQQQAAAVLGYTQKLWDES